MAAFAGSRLDRNFRLYAPLHKTLVTVLYEALVATGGEVVFNSRARWRRIRMAGCISRMEARGAPIWLLPPMV
jgi:hypothetical protein